MTAAVTEFGHRLQALIDHEGITRNTFSNRANIPYSTLKHSLENPGAVVSIDHLFGIHTTYPHWSMEYLLRGNGPLLTAKEEQKPIPKTPLEQVQYWIQVREQVREEMGRIKSDAWKPYVQMLATRVQDLLAENDDFRRWLNAQTSDATAS